MFPNYLEGLIGCVYSFARRGPLLMRSTMSVPLDALISTLLTPQRGNVSKCALKVLLQTIVQISVFLLVLQVNITLVIPIQVFVNVFLIVLMVLSLILTITDNVRLTV
jgi:hypothetical protein